MAWGSDTAAAQLTGSTTEQFFDQVPTLDPRETAHVQASVHFPGSRPTTRSSRSTPLGIYRWGWGFPTSQDFNGDIALIACFASSWIPAMMRRWHADPFDFSRPYGRVPHLPRPVLRRRVETTRKNLKTAVRSRGRGRGAGRRRAPPLGGAGVVVCSMR